MANVLCLHNMNTTKFTAKIHNGGKVTVQLTRGTPILIDERIAVQYPSTFTIINTVEAQEADSEEIVAEPETATDETEIVEPEGKTLVEVFEDLDGDGLFPDAFAVNLTDAEEKCDDNPESLDEVSELITEDVAEDLSNAIDGFKSKVKLDEYAAGLGVKLDRRKTLKDMKAELKKAWSL